MDVVLLLLIFCCIIVPATGTISSTHFRKNQNFRQTEAVKLGTSVNSVVQCGRLCSEDDKCESYNIVQENGGMQCEINDADSPITIIAGSTSLYYRKNGK